MVSYVKIFEKSVGLASVSVFIYVNILWIASLIIQRLDIVDIGWGPGFVVVSSILFYSSEYRSRRGILILILVSIWASRLAIHIGIRARHKSEDFRYHQLRRNWGNSVAVRSYFQIFIAQGIAIIIISGSIILVQSFPQPNLRTADFIGLSVWIIGFLCEAIADAQLARFKQLPRNKEKFIQSGLWRYSRHPNYFFESICW